jgi:hypothetical protein
MQQRHTTEQKSIAKPASPPHEPSRQEPSSREKRGPTE